MLKNNSLLWIVYWVLFLLIISVFLFSKFSESTEPLVFLYPDTPITFSGEEVPMGDSFIKQRFDKEFLSISNNLYQFYLYVKRYPLYIGYIEDSLDAQWIPDDFKYLPIAESALRNDVVSSAWAAWIWQFMPETAKEYGLIVNEQVDERYHFKKSTDAAIEHLSDLYNKFWNWTLAAAAYNRWWNGLQRALDDQNVDNYYDLYLNEETSRYVFRIVSIKYMMLSYFDKKKIIDTLIWWLHEIPDTKTVKVWKIDNISQWASSQWYSYKDIKILNRWIIGSSLPEWEWELLILNIQ